jgi:acetylornithine aminotransferase
VIPNPGYLAALRGLCDEHGWLLMLDEVQTGMGRTGTLFAFQQHGILPDVLTLAKGLGNGMPIGACLARGDAADVLGPGSHGSTFGGNPLACRAASAVLDVLESEQLTERAGTVGARMLANLRRALDGRDGVEAIRGRGLMLGVQLDRPCGDLVAAALADGLLINVTAGRVVRLLPPLVIDDQQADCIADAVARLILAFLAKPA